jgi:FkbH-like protein
MSNFQIETDPRVALEPAPTTASITIAGTFTVEPLKDSLEFWLNKLQLRASIEFAPYNHVMQSLLDPQGPFARNKAGLNVVLMRFEDWNRFRDEPESNVGYFAEDMKRLVSAFRTAARRASSPILVCVCPPSTAVLEDTERSTFFLQAEEELARTLREFSTIRFISSKELLNLYPVGDYDDLAADKLGHIPFKPEMFAAIGTVVARNFHACRRAPYKVIALDCDETLWAGICGENPYGVEIDSPRWALQNFMRDQKAQGMLLCVCSKNNPEDVDAVFAAHPEMPLRREDFAAWRVNWQAKSENIRAVADELHLGMDSFIFVDDNPMETAEVRASCPGVLTLTLPEAREQFRSFLDHVWAFDRFSVTAEDQNRTVMYQQSRARQQFQEGALSYADFLAGIALEIQIRELQPSEIARAAQLTQRTNQFNLSAQRYAEADIQRMMQCSDLRILTVFVRDRFGDYGQVGLILYEVRNGRIVVRNLWLSCRVLSRGVEHAMLARLGQIAQVESLSRVDVSYVRTPKNAPARDFLAQFPLIFRDEIENGFLYRFPADFAAGIKFSPVAWEEPKQNDGDAVSNKIRPSSDSFSSQVSFEWIATFACNAGLILEAVNATTSCAAGVRAAADVPRNELERQITLIWERVLAISPIGIHDNYFDLGGDSLKAVRIFVEVQELVGQDLPLVTLFEAPTIAQLAELLGDSNWKPHWRSLVPLKSSGTRPPFYCVHGVGGNVIEFRDMIRYFHPDQPFYGIQAIGLDGKSCRQNLTVEQMARHYIREIRELQPDGPYYFGGSSFGGLVAYEMARQVLAEGLEVGIVALFDTHGPGYPRTLPTTSAFERKLDQLRFRVSLHWSNLLATKPRQRPQYIWIKAKRCKKAIVFKTRSFVNAAHRSMKLLASRLFLPAAIRKVNQAGHWAAADYVPGEYPGSITLFRATRQPPGICQDPTLGWESVVRGRIDIYDTPGYHGTLVREPRAAELVRQVEDALRKAQRRASRSVAKAVSKT